VALDLLSVAPAIVMRLRSGLSWAFADPDRLPVRDALLIAGLEVPPPRACHCMAEMEADAAQQRYHELD